MGDKKIVVHIGPPKTATTSLQFFLQNMQIENTAYVGVFQPRHENKERNELRDNLFDFLRHGRERKRKIVKMLIDKVQCRNLIFSEEMILHGPNWKKKIRHLSELLEEYPHIVKVCVRDPASSIPSYYQEMYERLSPQLRNSYPAFVNSSYADIYDYENVYCHLQESGIVNVECFTFENLIEGKLTVDDFVHGHSLYGKKHNITLHKKNSSNGAVRKGHRVVKFSYVDELGDWSRYFTSAIRKMGSFGKSVVRQLRYRWRGQKEVRVGYTEREERLQQKYVRFISSMPE